MEILGLTGGIACGKSTVGALFAARGVPLVDADVVAREVTAPGSEGLAAVVAAFGDEVLTPAGALDRKRLGARVFPDEGSRAVLNGILHPRIAAESARRFAALAGEGHGFALYEAALLVELGTHRALGGLIVVTAQPSVQLARLLERDGAGEADARARIASQWPLARKVAEATYVIDNSGSKELLEARVAEVYASLVVAHGPPARRARAAG